WRSFFTDGGGQRPAEEAIGFMRRLLDAAFGAAADSLADLRHAGLRILPQGRLEPPLPEWPEGPLPHWTGPLLQAEDGPIEGVRYLLTFRLFGMLPEAVQRAYATGGLELLPFPGSLLFWGAPLFTRLCRELPAAMQIALLW